MSKKYNAKADAEAVAEAMRGFGTNEEKLNEILMTKPRDHVLDIIAAYNSTGFFRNMVNQIKREVGGDYQKVMESLMMTSGEYRLQCIKDAVRGIGTEEQVLIDCICCASTDELTALKDAWENRLRLGSLSAMVRRDIRGDLQKIVCAVLDGERQKGVNKAQVEADCKKLFDAAKGWGRTNIDGFIEVIAHRSHEHLQEVGKYYEATHKSSIEKLIKSETSGDVQEALEAAFMGPAAFTAHRIHDSIHGFGTNEDDAIRFVMLPDGHVLAEAAAIYQEKYGKDMAEHVDRDCGGHFGHALATRIKAAVAGHW